MTDIIQPTDSPDEPRRSSFQELERLFEQVAEVPKDRREAALEKLCPDPNLRQQVRDLLDADSSEDQLLDHSLIPGSFKIQAGQQIDGYTLVKELARGGMGVVFMAEQLEPVRRKVALKVIKPGVDTHEVIARFDAERHALSLMDHPNIARVLDAGSTESGRPYFVMELVQGSPITTYCDQKQLSPQKRLELFLPVCHAIQHAHQKGLIHRDIKPSNVLVAEYDGRPVAKVIDFGIAKAINQSLTDMTVATGLGQIIGTFEYMSPEQSRVDQRDVDTRSDIYSLGVLLYELLVGRPPFDKDRLRSVAWDEMVRIIREEDPPKPSSRIVDTRSRLTGTQIPLNGPSTRLSKRNTSVSVSSALPDETNTESSQLQKPRPDVVRDKQEQAKLVRILRGELDWIVMKAMDKDRNRRYETPNELANDIDRFLSGDAVTACPPSSIYLFRKFAKRNKVVLAASAMVAASLVLGLISTTNQATRAMHAEKKAVIAKHESEESGVQLRAANDFLTDDILGIAGAESQVAAGLSPDPNLKLETLLYRAESQLDSRFPKQSAHKAKLQVTLADSFNRIGRYEKAARLYNSYFDYLKHTKGIEHEETIRVWNKLAKVTIHLSRSTEAEKLCDEALEVSKKALGPEHELTLQIRNDLGRVYQQLERFEEAEKVHKECLEVRSRRFGDGHPSTLSIMSDLAHLNERMHRFERAEMLHQRVVEVYRKLIPTDELLVAAALGNHARCLLQHGRSHSDRDQFSKALPLLQEATEIYSEQRGEDHPDTIKTRSNLAQVYCELSEFAKAQPILEDLAPRLERLYGSEHQHCLDTKNALGWTYFELDRVAEAEHIFTDILESGKPLDPMDPWTREVKANLAIVQHKIGKITNAISSNLALLEYLENSPQQNQLEVLAAKARLGLAYIETNQTSGGQALLEEAFNAGPQQLGSFQIANVLAKSYLNENKLDQAMFWTHREIESIPYTHHVENIQVANILTKCGNRFLKMKAWEDALTVLRRSLAIRQSRAPDARATLNTQSLIEKALEGQKK